MKNCKIKISIKKQSPLQQNVESVAMKNLALFFVLFLVELYTTSNVFLAAFLVDALSHPSSWTERRKGRGWKASTRGGKQHGNAARRTVFIWL